jgi:hypothetical protein
VARLKRPLLIAATVVLLGLGVSACSNSAALSNARTACRHIDASLSTYKASQQPGISSQDAAALVAKAQSELLAALPYAASATSDDGSYNALMTGIQEADRVPEGLLVDSLQRQCQVIRSNSPYLGA